MRRRALRGMPLFLGLAASVGLSCGKRADPLAPYVKTPQAPGGLEAAQVGDEVEIRVTAPRLTTEGRPLPVIELEWLQAPAEGAFGKVAVSLLREEAAPGEIRTKRFKRPSSEARFSVRAFAGKAQSASVAPLLFKPAAVPPAPTSVQATNTAMGVELRWTNPPGAEPWPQPTPSPSPQGSPPPVGATPSPAESKTLAPPATGSSPSVAAETSTAKPSAPDAAKPLPAPGPERPGVSPSPSPKPQAPLALPTGIRIFRTRRGSTPRSRAPASVGLARHRFEAGRPALLFPALHHFLQTAGGERGHRVRLRRCQRHRSP